RGDVLVALAPVSGIMSDTVVFTNAGAVVTCTGTSPDTVLRDTDVVVGGGHIAALGSTDALHESGAERVDCRGGVLTPGFVDSHTHAVFGGWRAAEYALRSRGVPYMEIARQGGGINASVRDIRTRSEDELVELTVQRL